MFTLDTRNPNILRRTWYLSSDHTLCSRWTVEKIASSIEDVRLCDRIQGNQPCDRGV